MFRVPAPFQARLPQSPEPLPGSPAVVILGSEGWLPNRDGLTWFLHQVWPVLRQRLPAAVLHVFGIVNRPLGSFPEVVWHTPPHRIEPAFAPGSILAVPLRIASGVRIKVLEAWARGVPVVATPQAASGLEAQAGRELLLAGNEEEFATAIANLHHEPQRATALTAAGRALLEKHHAPGRVASQLVEIYRSVLQPR